MEVSGSHSPSRPCCLSLVSSKFPPREPEGLAGSPWWPDHALASTRGHFCSHLQCPSHRLLWAGWALHTWSQACVQMTQYRFL